MALCHKEVSACLVKFRQANNLIIDASNMGQLMC